MKTQMPEPDKLRVWGSPTRYYTDEQMKAYGAAEYKRAILDAMNATGAFGKTGEVIAMVIRQLGATP